MKLIIGLGNPGPEYDRTRHNVGFEVVDRLARRFSTSTTAKSKFHSAVLDADIRGEKTLLLRPTTFMNRSGLAVGDAARFYKVDVPSDVLVIVDEVALPCGAIRLRSSGGAGGHNGLRDIEQKLGTNAYARLRIGIDDPGQIPRASYVLGKFRPDQIEALEPALDLAADAAACWATDGADVAMNRFNQKSLQADNASES